MKIVISFILCIGLCSAKAQINKDVFIGVLQSVGRNQYKIVYSSSQPGIGVDEPISCRYDHPGLRIRFSLNKQLSQTFYGALQTGLNCRFDENLWGSYHTYVSAPIQLGAGYDFLRKTSFNASVKAVSGVNIFHIKNYLASRQTGSIHTAELMFRFSRNGSVQSVLITAGYEQQFDKETVFSKAIDQNWNDENFSYKVKRHQIYVSLGLGF
jgi:hypothetical protein